MTDPTNIIVSPWARWSGRIALFSTALVLVGMLLHHFASFPTPVAFNLFGVGFAGAALAALIGLVALVQIWRRGYAGTGSAALGILLPVGLYAWPLTYVPAYLNLPPITDVSTDTASPPRFNALAKRENGANPAAYPGERTARLQQAAYPDLRTYTLDRPIDETFELVEETARKLRWKVAAGEAPARTAKAAVLEATDKTLLLGFTDDVIVRIEGGATQSRIDVRSSSRYGQHDFGQNASRVRRFLTELHARADATGATATVGRRGRATRASAVVKRLKERDQKKVESRSGRDRARSDAQRERGQKGSRRRADSN
jgi:hypothetical protein